MKKSETFIANIKTNWEKFLNFVRIKSTVSAKTPKETYDRRPMLWIYNIILVLAFLAVMIYFSVDVSFMNGINFNGTRLGELWKGVCNPNWSYFFGYGDYRFSESVIYQIIETFSIAFIGTLISSILAIPFGFFASKRMVGKWSIISELFLILIRTFPEILFGLIMVKVVGFGSFAGVAVLSVHSIGMIGKMYSEQLDVVDNQPLEALDACGASFLTRVKLGVVPQVAPNFLSVILYRFDLNVRTASLLGLVGAGGIGYYIWVYSAFGTWSMLTPLLLGVVLLIIFVDIISSILRKKLL
jgi:phosphonate transport system permease protein